MLDLSQYEVSGDSAELAEYKRKVEKTAKEYAERHGWCRVINDVLRDLEIKPEQKITIDVATSLGITLTQQVLPSALIGLTDDEQKALVAGELKSLRIAADNGANGSLPVTPEMIADLSLHVRETAASLGGYVANEEVEGVGTWLFGSDDARVEHFFRDVYVRDGRIVNATGATINDYYRIQQSVCSSIDSYTLRRTSVRSERRHCAKCTDRVARFT
jgi:hypothetical protein